MIVFGAVKNKFKKKKKNLKMFMYNMTYYMSTVICVGNIDTYTSLMYIYLFAFLKTESYAVS